MTRCELMQINDNMNTDWQSAHCGDGRTVTRTELRPPPPPHPPPEAISGDGRYPPPPLLRQELPSINAYRQSTELVPSHWCGASRPVGSCLPASCGWLVPERREKQQLVQTATRPYSDLSVERDPRCTACHTRGETVQYRPRDMQRYAGPCVPLKTSREPVNTPIYQQSITVRDFASPGANPPWTRTKGNRRSFYDRFMADMCRLCVLADPLPEHGSLGGQMSQYQVDFDQKDARKLSDLYSVPENCQSSVPGSASAFAACHTFCNF